MDIHCSLSSLNVHIYLQSWMEDGLHSTRDAKVDMNMQSPSLLLKCLKIMENATFLSKDNQVDWNVFILFWLLRLWLLPPYCAQNFSDLEDLWTEVKQKFMFTVLSLVTESFTWNETQNSFNRNSPVIYTTCYKCH